MLNPSDDSGIVMTHLLDKAFMEASKLSPQEQDLIAGHILEELRSEKQWQHLFDESQDALSSLASEAALAEFKAGRTKDLDSE
ncbi:MAG: hypothetical protein AAFZ92_02540 [Pseudomonadota bacterium]